jgi:tetratricopeptide (TPR) repeat protein
MRSARPFVFSLVIVITAVFAAYSQPRPNLRNLQDQGQKAFEQRRYREAADIYGQIVRLAPTNTLAHFRKAVSHFNLKEYDDALASFSIALTQGFNRPLEIHKARAYIYFEQKNYDAALADTQKALALSPNDVVLLRGTMEILIEKKSYPEAITAAQNFLKVVPNDADANFTLARAYAATGNTQGQITAAETALARGTRDPATAYQLLGEACQKLKDLPCAIDAFQKGINLKAGNIETYRNLADLYRQENRIPEAIETSRKAIVAFPNANGQIYIDISKLYSLADRAEDALESARAGVQLLANDYYAFTNLCRASNDAKVYDQAIAACNAALQKKPNDGETNFYLGRALNLSGKTGEARHYAQAVKGLAEQVQAEPGSVDAWYLLGNAYFADNQREKAAEAYQKALEIAPKYARARYNLGITQTRLKNKPGATEQYTALQTLDARLAQLLKAEIDKM